jgi:hypothetical protein
MRKRLPGHATSSRLPKTLQCSNSSMQLIFTSTARYGAYRVSRRPRSTRFGLRPRAFENLVDLALQESVAFVLIAGDLWDGTRPDAAPGLFFYQAAQTPPREANSWSRATTTEPGHAVQAPRGGRSGHTA